MLSSDFRRSIPIVRDVVLGTRTRTRVQLEYKFEVLVLVLVPIVLVLVASVLVLVVGVLCILCYLNYRVCLVVSLPVAFYFLTSSR